MNIGFTYNVRHVKPDINNPQYIAEAEFDEPSTIEGITKSFESLGHTVYPVEADEGAYEKFKSLKGILDLVFNFAEGLHGADREAQIPAMLEMLQIPYTGPKPLGYALGLHKAKAKEVIAYHGIPTAPWILVYKADELKREHGLHYPVVAKPVGEGSSKGILAKNFVNTFEELYAVTKELIDVYHQPVLIEEFLEGREFTVGLLGNPVEVLPSVEIFFDDLPDDMPKADHYEAKWEYDNPVTTTNPFKCPADLDKPLKHAIEDVCVRTFQALEMADWARIDVRLDRKGIPNIIEVNCPPGIMPDPKLNSRFPMAARAIGLDFPHMLERILQSACSRYGISYHTN